jgi:hypothetical protein
VPAAGAAGIRSSGASPARRRWCVRLPRAPECWGRLRGGGSAFGGDGGCEVYDRRGGLGCAEFAGAGEEALDLRVALRGALPELVGHGPRGRGGLGVGGEHDGARLKEANFLDGPLREALRVVRPRAGLVVPLVLDDLKPERGAVGAGLEAGQEVPVVGGVEQVTFEYRGVGVLAEFLGVGEDPGPDSGVVAVVELDLHAGAGFAHGLGEGAADGLLEELPLEHGVDLVPGFERGEPDGKPVVPCGGVGVGVAGADGCGLGLGGQCPHEVEIPQGLHHCPPGAVGFAAGAAGVFGVAPSPGGRSWTE